MSSTTHEAKPAHRTYLRHARLIDGTGAAPRDDATLCIEDGRIVSVADNTMGSMPAQSDDEVIDLSGLTVLPGLINAHVHAGFKHLKGVPLRDFQENYLLACLQTGVTTLRDEGMFVDSSLQEVALRKQHFAQPHYPRIVTTGKYFAAPGGYGGMQPISVTSVEEAKVKVRELLEAGMDMVKTSLEDGLDPGTHGLPQLSSELLAAICDEAHRNGAKVSAHATQAHNLRKLVDAGIDDVAHMVYDELQDDLIRDMTDRKIACVPTLTVLKRCGSPCWHRGSWENGRLDRRCRGSASAD